MYKKLINIKAIPTLGLGESCSKEALLCYAAIPGKSSTMLSPNCILLIIMLMNITLIITPLPTPSPLPGHVYMYILMASSQSSGDEIEL